MTLESKVDELVAAQADLIEAVNIKRTEIEQASTAAGDAIAARNKAGEWAEKAEDVEVEAGQYSALHHSAKSAMARDKAQDWSEGVGEPGGVGTKSSKSHAADAEAAKDLAEAAAANLPNATTAGPSKFLQTNATGDGWLAQTAEEHLAALETTQAVTDTINVSVGATGDYPTVNAALEDLSKKYQHTYKNTGVRAVVTMQSGFALAEQLIFDGIDMSWITLTSVDAEVVVTRSALTIEVQGRFPCIAAVGGGQSCYLDFIGNMDTSGDATNRDGLLVSDTGRICGNSMGIKNAGAHGAYCNGGGSISCLTTMDNSGAGSVGAHCFGGGSISCVITMNNSGAGSVGAYCNGGGSISCLTTMNNSGADYGAYCRGGGSISCLTTMNNSGAVNNGAYCFGGGTISCRFTMDNMKGATPATSDTQVADGGYISRGGGNGGISQTAGVMTANGYINK